MKSNKTNKTNKKLYKKKNKYNTSNKKIKSIIKKMSGGIINNVIKRELLPITLIKDLIIGKNTVKLLVSFDGIKFKCLFGNFNLIIGDNEDDTKSCVKVEYTFDENENLLNLCELTYFFYNMSKSSCIVQDEEESPDNKIINNREFKATLSKMSVSSKIPPDYNKQFNAKILEFIDIINTNIGILCCLLQDKANINTLNCESITLSPFKLFERGYGFYNEFGYLFMNSSNVNPDDIKDFDDIKKNGLIETSVDMSNHFLLEINKIANLPLNKILEKLKDSSSEKSDILKEILIVTDLCTKYKIDIKITLKLLIGKIMQTCKSTEMTPLFMPDPDLKRFVENIGFILFELLKMNDYTNFSDSKFYQYSDSGNVLVSQLDNKSIDAKRQFKMVLMKKHELTLEKIADSVATIKYNYTLTIS